MILQRRTTGNENQIHQSLALSPEITQKLQEEAGKNPTFAAVCNVFSMRERSRRVITINGLMLYMEKEGFQYTRSQYVHCLTFLVNIGVAKADLDLRNKFKGIKDITVALQTLGAAALAKPQFKPKIESPRAKVTMPKVSPRLPKPASMTIKIGDREITLDIGIEEASQYLLSAIKSLQ